MSLLLIQSSSLIFYLKVSTVLLKFLLFHFSSPPLSLVIQMCPIAFKAFLLSQRVLKRGGLHIVTETMGRTSGQVRFSSYRPSTLANYDCPDFIRHLTASGEISFELNLGISHYLLAC